MITIDGSQGEGGGQIIRNAIVYAILLKIPLTIHSIRSKRSKPGLRAQHVTGIALAMDIVAAGSSDSGSGGGTLVGNQVGSCTLAYYPCPPSSSSATCYEDCNDSGNAYEYTNTNVKMNVDDTGNIDAGNIDTGNIDARNIDAGNIDIGNIDTKHKNQQQQQRQHRRRIVSDIGTAGSICLLLQVGFPCWLYDTMMRINMNNNNRRHHHHHCDNDDNHNHDATTATGNTTATLKRTRTGDYHYNHNYNTSDSHSNSNNYYYPEKDMIIESLELRGGTNADMAPQIDYFMDVFVPTISKHCFPQQQQSSSSSSLPIINVTIPTRGYYPIGKGIVQCHLNQHTLRSSLLSSSPSPIHPITLIHRGTITNIHLKCYHAGKVKRFLAQKLVTNVLKTLKLFISSSSSLSLVSRKELSSIQPTVEIIHHNPAIGNACGILLYATTSSSSSSPQNIFCSSIILSRNEKVQDASNKVVQEFLYNLNSGGCVDEWLQDQLILFMALAKGTSRIKVGCLTLHTQTAIDIAVRMTGATFEVTKINHHDDNDDFNKGTNGDDFSGDDSKEINDTAATNTTTCDHYKEKAQLNLQHHHPKIEYGKVGLIHGQHLITCTGIGFVPS